MKRVSLVVLILILAIIMVFSGCRAPQEPQRPVNGTEKPQEPGDQKPFPDAVMNWLENMREYFVAGAVDLGDETFLIVNWGKQPTLGYNVDIAQVLEENDIVIVMVEFKEPEGPAGEALTYPHDIEVIKRTDREIFFEDQDGYHYIPMIIGQQPVKPFVEESRNIKVMEFLKEQGKLMVAGIARVFEATVSYSFEKGQEVLEEGFTTALSGGPDWGYFKIERGDIPNDAEYIVLFQVNMEDGSRMDEVRLKLNP